MVFEHIEKLKHEYTDQYVVVDQHRPELLRFHGLTGTVKTVNMSGRALVQFDGNNNIGWFDIDIDFLKVVDKPVEADPPKTPAKAADKPAAPKKTSPKKSTKAKGAGKKEMSIEDMMAAARGKASGGGTATAGRTPDAKPAGSSDKMSVADIMAAARRPQAQAAVDVGAQLNAARKPQGDSAAPAATRQAASSPTGDAKSMSIADILAAARGGSSAGADNSVAATTESAPSESAAEPEGTAEAETSEAAAQAGSEQSIPTDVPGMIAYCRRVDSH